MGKTYKRSMEDFEELVFRNTARRHARELAELAGGTAIADQGYRRGPFSRPPARPMDMALRRQ